MSDEQKSGIGTIGWIDLTVGDAGGLRDFYGAVAGWRPEPVDMSGYSDFNMVAPGTGEPAAGICHRRAGNAELPPAWLIYIVVADLDASLESCHQLGGKLISGPRQMGKDRYCVIQDPAGAFAALYQQG